MSDYNSTEQFWKLVDEAHARALVNNAINAARAQVEYSRALTTSQRAVVLLGTNASREYEARAEMHHQTRRGQLRNTKQALARFAAGLDEGGKQRIAEYLNAGGLKDLTTHARQSTVLTLLHADLPPDAAQNAVNALDGTLGKVVGLTSWQEIVDYLNQHLDELHAQKMGEAASANGFCLLILILSSVLLILVLVAVIVNAIAGESDSSGELDQLINQICGPS